MVFFEAPHRLDASVRDMADAFGMDRRAAVCRELTKTYEEVKRDSLGELARWAEGEVRGEITIVVAGASDDERRDASGLGDDEAIAAAVRKRMESGLSRKEAAAEVADRAGLSKRYVYDVSLRTVDDT
jgi:16S rRNA (cytidine1402-2'-O)-methyltransferase